jgi:uracil permease
MGGIMLLLFGAITVVGLNSLVKAGEDLTEPRNLAIVALILVFGIGGMAFSASEFALKGIGLAGITGVVLNLVLPRKKAAVELSAEDHAEEVGQ